jgi:hypothetical protein
MPTKSINPPPPPHTHTVLITGCIFSSTVMFSNTIGAGGFVYNVAGTVLFTGCVFNANGAFYQSSGIGYLSFNSAGLSIFTVSAPALELRAAWEDRIRRRRHHCMQWGTTPSTLIYTHTSTHPPHATRDASTILT